MHKYALLIFFILVQILSISTLYAETYDPDILSNISNSLADWKLRNQDNQNTKKDPQIYLTSSLSGKITERDEANVSNVFEGLGFNSDSWDYEVKLKRSELKRFTKKNYTIKPLKRNQFSYKSTNKRIYNNKSIKIESVKHDYINLKLKPTVSISPNKVFPLKWSNYINELNRIRFPEFDLQKLPTYIENYNRQIYNFKVEHKTNYFNRELKFQNLKLYQPKYPIIQNYNTWRYTNIRVNLPSTKIKPQKIRFYSPGPFR